jgi:alkylation response protein AidB-like acyl-CoA dehydrogenase
MTNLLYTDVDEQLRASVRDLLAARAPWTDVLSRAESGEPYDRALWPALARDLGVAGLAVTEAAGGHGATWGEVAVVAEELGRSVAGTPFLGSTVLATAVTRRADDGGLLPRLADGTTTAAVAIGLAAAPGAGFPRSVRFDGGTLTGEVRGVADAGAADVLLVPAVTADGPVIVSCAAMTIEPVTSLDLTRPLADVRFDGLPGSVIASGESAAAALDAALLAGAVVLASEQVGLAQRCLEMTVEYLKNRYQFGRQIGSFQALKHRCADLWAAIAQARAVARYAAACLADDDADLAVAAALAQAYCSPVAVKAAEECVQLHGGIGFTWEHPAHLYLKRAKADSIAFGTASRHRSRLAELVDLPAAKSEAGGDDGGRAQLLVPDDPRCQARLRGQLGRPRRLHPAGLDHQPARRAEPGRRGRGDPAVHVQAVGPAVQREPWLVQPGLRRHQRDRLARHVRRVGDEDIHPPAQRIGQRRIQITLVHPRALAQVPPRAPHGHRLDLHRMQLGIRTGREHRCADRAHPAAQLGDHTARTQHGQHLGDQQLRAAAGHEHARLDGQTQPGELHPTEQELQRLARDPSGGQRVQLGRRARRLGQQARLVLGEHATGRTQPRHEVRATGQDAGRSRSASRRWARSRNPPIAIPESTVGIHSQIR